MSAPSFLNSLIIKETSELEAVTTAPTKGTPAVDLLTYHIMGPMMHLYWQFEEGADGGAGSGIYLLKVPGSYEIDDSFVSIGTDPHSNIVGKFAVLDSAGTPIDLLGWVVAYDSTHLAFVADGAFVAHNNLGLDSADAPVTYSVQAVIPVKDRNYQY